MARPPRHNADYYTHNADLRNDRRVKAIRTKFGAAGYGLLHMLLEALTDADHTQLDTDPLEIELLAGDFGVSATEIHELLQFGESIGYFQRNEADLLICSELNKWLEPVFEKRNRTRNAAPAGLLSQSASETGVSVTENPQSKVKESKGEKSKGGGVAPPPPSLEILPERPAENPAPADEPPPRVPAAPAAPKYYASDASIFKDRKEFSDYIKSLEAHANADIGHYLTAIPPRAEEATPNQRSNAGWKLFILKYLENDKQAGSFVSTTKKGERQPTNLLRPHMEFNR